jgi:hypothetical protein
MRSSLISCLFLNAVPSEGFALPALSLTRCRQSPSQTDVTARQRIRIYQRLEGDDSYNLPDPTSLEENESEQGQAATRTVNERLQAELEELKRQEQFGAKSSLGKKMGLDNFASFKSDAEKQAAIEEARDLNGVNPLVAVGGSFFALVVAGGLWLLTLYLAQLFAAHPVTTDVYAVQRAAAVFRNIIMGLTSLASGFFGVCGFGIFLLGIRVAYGVATGELDPTPIKNAKQEIEMPNVWDLMLNKKQGRRGGK